MENRNFQLAMEAYAVVRDVVKKGDPRQDPQPVDHHLDEERKALGEWKDLYHEERNPVVVF